MLNWKCLNFSNRALGVFLALAIFGFFVVVPLLAGTWALKDRLQALGMLAFIYSILLDPASFDGKWRALSSDKPRACRALDVIGAAAFSISYVLVVLGWHA